MILDSSLTSDPHRNQPLLHAGVPLDEAVGAVILLHGRGASAEDILGLAQAFLDPGLAYLAPQAAGHTWYPNSFLTPRPQNEPFLSSALARVGAVVHQATDAGLSLDRIVLCGFSQGACLATEFVATHPARYGALIAYTGGLIGPPEAFSRETDSPYSGDLDGMPAFFGSGDPDPHVPWNRIEQSARILRHMGATVTTERYPGRPHSITPHELAIGRKIVLDLFT